MRYWKDAASLSVIFLTALSLSVGASSAETTIHFMSLDKSHPCNLSGTLYLPPNASKPCPAIVMVHGTMGIDSRGALYRDPIVKAGMAVFEVDFKTGIYTTPLNRPKPETLLAMGFAALKELRKLPAIDPDRIGILGFSMGGHLAVYSAFEHNRQLWMGSEKGFAAHVGFYPVCKTFVKQKDLQVTGAPMIIFYGTEDSYGDGKAVPELKSLLLKKDQFEVTTVEYAGAMHGFNRDAPPISYVDPAATHMRGRMAYDANATNDSLVKVIAFLRQNIQTLPIPEHQF